MNSWAPRLPIVLTAVTAILLGGCEQPAPPPLSETATPIQGIQAISTRTGPLAAIPSPTQTLHAAPTQPAATAIPSSVHVRAVGGNVFIRRGPDIAFNPVGILMAGRVAPAQARDVLGKWLQIEVPGTPAALGWISILTQYTSVSGNAQALPALSPSYWPVLASVRNCTHHQMIIEPGGTRVPPIEYFPDNDVRANPGQYTISDLDVDGYPEVLKVSIREGSAIDIVVDGSGNKKKCPVP
jgi:hypothetical protein